jgi:integrase
MILVNIQLAPDLPAQRLETLKAAERALDDPVSEECGAFLEASRGERLEALYILAVTTGMRRGELLGLKWSDVDVENATVSIRRTLTRTDNGKRVSLGEPKTKKSRRTVRLTQRAIEALRSYRARQAEEKLKAVASTRIRASYSRMRPGVSSTSPTCVSGLSRRSSSARICPRSPSTT